MVQTQSFINESSITEILPGGSNSDSFELAEAWYPVHYLQDLVLLSSLVCMDI